MKKILSALMILVMMLCFNTRLYVFAKGLTVMQSCAIVVLNVVELIYWGYRCYKYGINEALRGRNGQTEACMQNAETLQDKIVHLEHSFDRQYTLANKYRQLVQKRGEIGDIDCSAEYQKGRNDQAESDRRNMEEMQHKVLALYDKYKLKSSELDACKNGRN